MRLYTRTKELNKRGPRDVNPEWAAAAGAWMDWISTAPAQQCAEILAWSIEWEGNIGVHERVSPASYRGVSHGVEIAIPQSVHRFCLLQIMQKLAGGRGYFTGVQIDPRPGNAARRTWKVEGLADAKVLAKLLVPHLRYKKRLAELVTEFPECDTKPVPLDIFTKRRALAEESKRLNS